MKSLVLAFLLLQDVEPPCELHARTGDQILFSWESPVGDETEWRLTRQSSEKGSETLVSKGPNNTRELIFMMPGGYTKFYLLRVRPILKHLDGSEDIGAASEECIIKRVK